MYFRQMLFLFVVIGLTFFLKAKASDVAITMDDFDVNENTKFSASERNGKILSALDRHNIRAGIFIVGKYVNNEFGRKLLKEWDDEGHLIGNHTFTHPSFNRTSLESFQKEIEKCESVLKHYKNFEKLFRFPTLAEGETSTKRDALRAWLKKQDYKLGEVTIDASDWYIDQRMREKLKIDPTYDLNRYRDYYLNHIWDRAQYYNKLINDVLGHEVRHTLLVHFNLLNALFLDDVLNMFEKHGWKLIDAKDAFRDPIFSREPQSMPSGQSLIWALAKESGKFDDSLRYPGEDAIYEKAYMDKLGL